MRRKFTREYLVNRFKRAEAEYKGSKGLLAVFDKSNDCADYLDTGTVEERIKKKYYQERSVRTVAEWVMENIKDFASNKSDAMLKIKELILNSDSNDHDLDWAVRFIFGENAYYANKYGD